MMGNEIDNDPEPAHNETQQLKFSTSGHMTSNDVILTSFRRGDVASTSYDVVSTSFQRHVPAGLLFLYLYLCLLFSMNIIA